MYKQGAPCMYTYRVQCLLPLSSIQLMSLFKYQQLRASPQLHCHMNGEISQMGRRISCVKKCFRRRIWTTHRKWPKITIMTAPLEGIPHASPIVMSLAALLDGSLHSSDSSPALTWMQNGKSFCIHAGKRCVGID